MLNTGMSTDLLDVGDGQFFSRVDVSDCVYAVGEGGCVEVVA